MLPTRHHSTARSLLIMLTLRGVRRNRFKITRL